MNAIAPPRAGKSTFVTVLAWISIAMSGFGTLVGVLQSIMVFTLFRGPEMQHAADMAATDPNAPPYAAALMTWAPWTFVFFCLVSAGTFAASIGLLRRLNWARLVFIGLLALGILWQFVGLAIQHFVFASMPSPADFGDTQGEDMFATFMVVMRVFSIVLAIGMAALFGWFIKKLVSPAIVAEFR
jgi:hypothetical protein